MCITSLSVNNNMSQVLLFASQKAVQKLIFELRIYVIKFFAILKMGFLWKEDGH